jgi:hypothetical protein
MGIFVAAIIRSILFGTILTLRRRKKPLTLISHTQQDADTHD